MPSSDEIQSVAACRQLREMWEYKTGDRLGPAWDPTFLDWIKNASFGLLTDAIQQVVAPRYLEDGDRVPPNIGDVPKYAFVLQEDEAEPGMLECYLVRGRLRKKFYCEKDDGNVLELLRQTMRAGVSASHMHRAVEESNTLDDCFAALRVDRTAFRIAMGEPIFGGPAKDKVFIREEDQEWSAWNAYLQKATGKGAPMNKHFGWYFPTRLPPVDGPPPKRRSRSRR